MTGWRTRDFSFGTTTNLIILVKCLIILLIVLILMIKPMHKNGIPMSFYPLWAKWHMYAILPNSKNRCVILPHCWGHNDIPVSLCPTSNCVILPCPWVASVNNVPRSRYLCQPKHRGYPASQRTIASYYVAAIVIEHKLDLLIASSGYS